MDSATSIPKVGPRSIASEPFGPATLISASIRQNLKLPKPKTDEELLPDLPKSNCYR